jgi:hypothetical protein
VTFSVGVLYSSIEFLKLLLQEPIDSENFRASFTRYIVASPDDVLKVCQECGWIHLDNSGYIQVAPTGKRLLDCNDYALSLRIQIQDLIRTYQPTWAKRMRHGRAEVQKFFPDDVVQCFREAGLLSAWTNETIRWWDELAQTASARRSAELLETGRTAERLTIEHERQRTKTEPKWQSLESNFSGFDILSQVSETDPTPLKIEVKGTILKKKDAAFFLTRNEWGVADDSTHYKFYLWALSSNPPELLTVDKSEIDEHLPSNNGQGTWETVKIPYPK